MSATSDSPSLIEQALDRNPVTMAPDTSLEEAIATMSASGSSYVLVVQQQKILGIFTERDVVRLLTKNLCPDIPLFQVMTPNPIAVSLEEARDIFNLLTLLRLSKIRHLPITDADGNLIGIVTQSTLLQALDPVEMYATVQLLQRTIAEKTQQLRQANEQLQQEVTQRQQIQAQLHQAKENLEAEVAARILEITATNQQLQQALLERISAEAEVRRLNAELEDRVQQRTAQLATSNQELQQTLAHLQVTQQELIQSEKMAALGHLIAGIAHEINTPLGAIRSSVKNIADFLEQNLERLPEFFQQLDPERYADFFALLRQAIGQPENFSAKQKRQFKKILRNQLEACQIEDADTIADTLVDLGVYQDISPFVPLLESEASGAILKTAYQLTALQKSTETIKTATDWAAKMVFALKNYARFDTSGEKVRSQVTDGIDTVLTLYHNAFKPGINLTKNYESNLPAILCYPDELNQVWTNLIYNALQAMNYQGDLNLEVKTRDSWIIVSITDSGTGVPPEIVSRIFEPFFTTKPPGEGSGLGLDIVKKIIDKHGGQITVESVPGQTTFSVFLQMSSNEEDLDV